MADMMVGHGPAPDFGPYVPGFLVVMDERGRRRVVSRDGDSEVSEERLPVSPCVPEPVRAGSWPLVFSQEDLSGPKAEWFPLPEEARWRPARARVLLESVKTSCGPELALRTVRAAAALISVDISKMAEDLSAEAIAGESLDETYERQKKR